MQQTVSDPSFLYASNRNIIIPSLHHRNSQLHVRRNRYGIGKSGNPSNYNRSFSSVHHRDSQLRVQKLILCASNRRNRYGIGKSGKLMFETACIIASKLGFVPEPLGLMLREFGAGNGNRGGNGFWNGFGFGWNGFDGWKRRRRSAKLGMVGILAICGVLGMWLVLDADADALFGGLGLIMFAVSGWGRGANKDWILGFCCCAFLVGLVSKKEEFLAWAGCFRTTKKNIRRKRRAF